jgi:hypothetical protein
MPHSGRRNADEILLLVLACGATAEAAAQKAGVSKTTVHRRLNDPEFRRRLQQARAEMLQRTTAALTASSMEAVKTLVELQGPKIPPSVRLGAARAVLELGTKLRETVELEERVRALEMRNAPEVSR